jgi:hypothetical protein
MLRAGMLAASVIMIVGSALCAGAYGAGGSIDGMFAALIVYRLITGIGSALVGRIQLALAWPATRPHKYRKLIFLWLAVGAEYPSGSVAASESTENVGVPARWQHGLFVLATNTAVSGRVYSDSEQLILITFPP